MFWFKKPKVSVIVLVYRMQREAPRTLYSLSTAYQQGVSAGDYEVIAVENPSPQMLQTKAVRRLGRQFRHVVHPGDATSPAAAMNYGASLARGQHLMLMIDGARILSPGVLSRTLRAHQLHERSVVATLAWHLGPAVQSTSIHQGYDQEVEDQLLDRANWQQDGYDLFRFSSLAGSCQASWFGPMAESNCITVSRQQYDEMGGFCEEFQTAGGGFVNLDFFARATADPTRPTVLLLGEGTFHQVHGGVATNRVDDKPLRSFVAEYQRIRGKRFTPPAMQPILFGHMPKAGKKNMQKSILNARNHHRTKYPSVLRPVALDPSVDASAPAPDALSTKGLTVLGMHRSGTSCLAGTLMECGVYFGQVSRSNPHNTKGNNENQQIMGLQERLLTDNGGAWDSPPHFVLWNDDHRRIRDEIIEQYSATDHAHWGFKDPRTLLTLDGWLERLPDLRLVGVIRHPDAVAQSLTNRNLFPRPRGLNLWFEYNRRLLDLHRKRPFPIIRFTEDPQIFRAQLRRLVDCLGIDTPADGFAFFEPKLQHCQPAAPRRLPDHVADVYHELRDIAARWLPSANRQSQRKAS